MQPETEPSPDSAPLLAAALASAGESEESSKQSPKDEGAPQGSPAPTPAQVVSLCEWALSMAVHATAKSARLPLDSRVQELARFEPAERDTLELLAPAAVPLVGKALANGEKIAAWAFVGAFGLFVVSRIREVRELAAIRASERAATAPSSSAAAPAT